jgi:cysteine dioxygenase
MTTSALPTSLRPLVEYLDGLTGRPELKEVSDRLAAAEIGFEDLRELAIFDDQTYRRNTVAEGPWYSLLVLCWRSGQRSPIHDHAQSVCAFKVLTGVCSETVYEIAACGQVYPIHTDNRMPGSIVATQDADIHQVSNLQPAPSDLVTLHLYSPPLKAMNRYSITGEQLRPFSAAGSFDADMYVI